MTSLADHLADQFDEPAEEEREGFHITTSLMADWGLRKLRTVLAKVEEDCETAEAEHRLIDEWLKRETAKHEDTIRSFRGLLSDWHRRALAADPRAKTIELPAGRLVARKQPDRIEIADVDEFLALNPGAPTIVRTTVSPDKRAILADVKETGEILPGVQFIPGEVAYKQETT